MAKKTVTDADLVGGKTADISLAPISQTAADLIGQTPPAEIPQPPAEPVKPAQPIAATEIGSETDLLNELEHGLDAPEAAPGEAAQPLPGEVKDINKWKCPRCSKSYEYRSFLVRHINRAYGGDAPGLIASIPPAERSTTYRKNPRKADFSDLTQAAVPGGAVDYQGIAGMTFDMSTGMLSNMFGPEWLARRDEPGSDKSKERDHMIAAIANYMRSKDMPDMPPGIMLTICCVAYAAPRFQQPSTKSKIAAMWVWLSGKFKRKPRLKVV